MCTETGRMAMCWQENYCKPPGKPSPLQFTHATSAASNVNYPVTMARTDFPQGTKVTHTCTGTPPAVFKYTQTSGPLDYWCQADGTWNKPIPDWEECSYWCSPPRVSFDAYTDAAATNATPVTSGWTEAGTSVVHKCEDGAKFGDDTNQKTYTCQVDER